MIVKKEGKCPLCKRHERYETETSLYTCPNRKCKLSHFWFSPAEWSRLCRSQSAFEEDDTLRDRFAMAALTGLIAINDYEPLDLITKTSFSIADECMKQRKAREGEL